MCKCRSCCCIIDIPPVVCSKKRLFNSHNEFFSLLSGLETSNKHLNSVFTKAMEQNTALEMKLSKLSVKERFVFNCTQLFVPMPLYKFVTSVYCNPIERVAQDLEGSRPN